MRAMRCEPFARLLPAYADNELSVESALDVERHLRTCTPCHTALERQRALAHAVGQLYPHAPLPPGLEDRVRRRLRTAPGRSLWVRGLALAAAVLLGLGVVWKLARTHTAGTGTAGTPASVLAAAEMHRHAVPLAIRSSDAAAVNAWLRTALPFPLNDAVRPTPDFTLLGAATVDLAGERVGYVEYRRDAHAVSLFLLPPRTWPAAGRTINVRAIDFHLFTVDGLTLVTWNHPPLSYVLVSDLGAQGAQACAVCHDSVTDAVGFPGDGAI